MAPPNRSARVAVLGSSLQRSKQNPYPSRGRSAMVRRIVLAVLVIAALGLLTISFRSPTSGVLHDAQSYGSDALRPFQVAAVRVARPFRDGYDYVDSLAGAILHPYGSAPLTDVACAASQPVHGVRRGYSENL